MNDKELDKLFRERLKQHAVPPRKDIWHQIENQLDQEKAVPVRKLAWVSYAAMAIGCLGLMVLLYRVMQPTRTLDMPTIAQKEITSASTKVAREPSTSTPSVTPDTKRSEQLTKQDIAKTEVFVQEIADPAQRNDIGAPSSQTQRHRLELVALKPAELSVSLTSLHVDANLPPEYAINVPPIAPLIDNPETEESMLASSRKPTEGIVPGILNKISDALNPTDNATIQFSKDEEGFLRLDIVNSLVKNRNKKRR